MDQPDALDEQKAALRALVTLSEQGPVAMKVVDGQLAVNGEVLPPALTGVQALRTLFVGHAVAEMLVDIGAQPADLVGTARVLATVAVTGDDGREVDSKLRAIAPRSVRVVFRRTTAEVDPHMVQAFTAVDQPHSTADQAFVELEAATSLSAASRLLDQIIVSVEEHTRANDGPAAADALAKVVAAEAAQTDPELKRAFAAAVRRLSKPTALRAVAAVLPRRRDRIDDYLAVLARTGDAGAEALIEQLTAAQALSERRIFFDALVRLKAGTATLIHMLGDPRWYVARNAADLLGELRAVEADGRLAQLLTHEDERVRRAAAHALGKLATPAALAALRKALVDPLPDVRALAAGGLAIRRGAPSAGTLLRALEDEADGEVQLAILRALGRVGTAEAVLRLAKAAEQSPNPFKRKTSTYRIAAIQGLGEARTPAALAALQSFAGDRDREVREAVARALAAAAKPEPTTLA